MPKSRSSSSTSTGGGVHSGGTGGNGAGGGGGGVVSAAPLDAIEETIMQPVTVMSHSSTRGYEPVTVRFTGPGRAMVTSGSGNIYNVDTNEGTCECMDHRMRQRRCRHIRAVEEAMGQTAQIVRDAPVTDGAVSPGVREVEDVAGTDAASPEPIEYENDNFFISDMNDDEFNAMLEEATRQQPAYEYENVLNGSNTTFGLEIEYRGGDNYAIARELAELGLAESADVLTYGRHHRTRSSMSKWRVTLDGTVSGEVISPVLRDTPETWRQIEKICEVIKRHGGRIDDDCGGHVHVGIDAVNHSKHRWRRLKRIIGNFEDMLYRLSRGDLTHLRSRASGYAVSIGAALRRLSDRRINIEENEGDEGIRRVAQVLDVRNSRYTSVNFANLRSCGNPDSPKTVEFRCFNGSLTPSVIQTHVKVAVGIVDAARAARANEEETRRRGEMLRNYNYDENHTSGHSMVKNFLDIVFTRKRDKLAILNRYAQGAWERV